MKLIERETYLNELKDIVKSKTPDIKVITGVRRSGKSKLLEALNEYINNYDYNSNTIHVNFSLLEFSYLLDYKKLNEYVESKYIEGKNNYILIDEVQMCKGFEKAINSFHASEKYDIYITGSNAFLSSSDLATLFVGRSYEIKVYPFSFKEYLEYYKPEDIDKAFDNYFVQGGMSGSYLYNDQEKRYEYIKEVYQTLIRRDIVDKYKIRNQALLDKINSYLMDNIGNTTSMKNISNYLANNKEVGNHITVGNYINYLCNAYVFYKFNRYDIRGKRILSTDEKYYIVDQSFRFSLLGTRNLDYGHIYENIVAMELLKRGYEVYVGKLYQKEIDFVAIKREEKLYIQVSDDISNEKTFNREISPLLAINDNYPKLIIARTKHDETINDGIKIIDIARWLINN